MMQGRIRRLSYLVPLLAAFALTGCDEPEVAATQKTAPDLAALDLADHAVKLGDYHDKVVLVTFWLNGCGPCLAEFPELDAVYRKHRDQGFTIAAVNLGQDKTVVAATLRKVPVTFPLLVDPLGITAKRYGVDAAPTAFLIDAKGIVRERIDGPVTADEMERKIEALL